MGNGRGLVTLAKSRAAKLYIVDVKDRRIPARPITVGSDDSYGVAWLTNGSIVYGSNAGGNPDLWVTNGEDGSPQQLTTGAAAETDPAGTSDGRQIVFTSNLGGRHVWKINADGTDQRQLTSGPGEATPVISSDDQYVLYFSFAAGAGTLERVPLAGGKTTVLTTGMPRFPTISPDGKWLSFSCRPGGAKGNKICVVPAAEPGAVPRVYNPVAGARSPGPVRWLKDNSGFSYIVLRQGVGNIWAQPLNGAPAAPLTNFAEGQIYAFDWSPDGRKLICARGESLSQIVLFQQK
jgi:Tol biopolymer transport system component